MEIEPFSTNLQDEMQDAFSKDLKQLTAILTDALPNSTEQTIYSAVFKLKSHLEIFLNDPKKMWEQDIKKLTSLLSLLENLSENIKGIFDATLTRQILTFVGYYHTEILNWLKTARNTLLELHENILLDPNHYKNCSTQNMQLVMRIIKSLLEENYQTISAEDLTSLHYLGEELMAETKVEECKANWLIVEVPDLISFLKKFAEMHNELKENDSHKIISSIERNTYFFQDHKLSRSPSLEEIAEEMRKCGLAYEIPPSPLPDEMELEESNQTEDIFIKKGYS